MTVRSSGGAAPVWRGGWADTCRLQGGPRSGCRVGLDAKANCRGGHSSVSMSQRNMLSQPPRHAALACIRRRRRHRGALRRGDRLHSRAWRLAHHCHVATGHQVPFRVARVRAAARGGRVWADGLVRVGAGTIARWQRAARWYLRRSTARGRAGWRGAARGWGRAGWRGAGWRRLGAGAARQGAGLAGPGTYPRPGRDWRAGRAKAKNITAGKAPEPCSAGAPLYFLHINAIKLIKANKTVGSIER